VAIESMEQRMLFDASVLTEAIISKTIPASVVSNASLHATATVRVTDNSGTTQSGPYEIGVFFADGALDVPSKNFVILGTRHVGNLALANGKSKTFALLGIFSIARQFVRGALARFHADSESSAECDVSRQLPLLSPKAIRAATIL